jgi:exodeoxyribonuclease X
MNSNFDRIVVIDFETTGTSRDKRAVEVAWFELNQNLEIIDEQNSLINPMIPIPLNVIQKHGITDAMVENSPTLDEFIVDINQDTFANSSVCVVAHNLSFDLPLFENYCGEVVELCSLKLVRKLYPEMVNHQLSTISEQFGFVHEEAHRARSDALQVVHFLTLVKETHGLSISQMVDMTRPKNEKRKSAAGDMPSSVHRSGDLKEEPIESKLPDSGLIVEENDGKNLIYEFTDWDVHSLANLCSQLYEQGIETNWSGNVLTVSGIFEDSVNAILIENNGPWIDTNQNDETVAPELIREYNLEDWQISELTDLVNELDGHGIEHDWVGPYLHVSKDDGYDVEEIIHELSLNPEFARNSFEEFKYDSSGKYGERLRYSMCFKFCYFTIPQLIELENELVEEDVTHFWKGQSLYVDRGDVGVVKTIMEEDFGITHEPSRVEISKESA